MCNIYMYFLFFLFLLCLKLQIHLSPFLQSFTEPAHSLGTEWEFLLIAGRPLNFVVFHFLLVLKRNQSGLMFLYIVQYLC